MTQFLSPLWFDNIEKLNHDAGNLYLPASLDAVVLNIEITGKHTGNLHLKNGKITQGLSADAVSTVRIDADTLEQIIQANDINLAIEAFMMGKIRIDGDMSAVMNLQTTKPTPEQKALYKKIKQMTTF